MNTLHVFGDSFAEDFPSSWTRQVAAANQLSVNNCAKGGTSIEWSMLQFLKTPLASGDVVIFVLTNSSRFDIEPYVSTIPEQSYIAKEVESLNDANLEWYVGHRSQELIDIKPSLYASLIHSISLAYPSVKFLVISAFPDSNDTSIIRKTDNFIVMDSTSLNEISHYEVNEIKLNPYMLYNLCGSDPRVNHLSTTNHSNLSKIVNQTISDWDSSLFVIQNFTKNVIDKKVKTLKDMHTYYVDTGIFDKEWVALVTKPVAKIRKSFWDIFR